MLVRNWEELSKIQNESDTHILEVNLDNCNGWLRCKNPKPYDFDIDYMEQAKNLNHYLSTHTFYGTEYENSTKIFKACGFDVEIDNWDKDDK